MLSVVAKGHRLCSRYTLLEKLGEGGQGEIWRARDEPRGTDVALKIVPRSEAAWQAFEREHAVVSRLDHPSILRIHPPYRDERVVVLPMELVTGGDLRRLRGADYLEIVPVLIEIAQALEYAHEHGVIHRDLKPSNVLFDSHGRPRLADFGIAGTALAAAATGGSPFTASPEQLRGEPPAVTDDIYGLGALAYELLSGYPPHYPHFDMRRVLEEPVPDLQTDRQIPPRLKALVMRMLAKRADLRPRSMREVIDDLDAVLNDTLVVDRTPIAEPKKVADGLDVSTAQAYANETIAFERAAAASTNDAVSSMVSSGVRPSGRVAASPFVASTVVNITEPNLTARRNGSAATPMRAERVRRPTLQAPERRYSAPPSWSEPVAGPVPSLMRLEREKPPRRWPWVALTLFAALAVFGVFYWLPNFAPKDIAIRLPSLPQMSTASTPSAPGVTARGPDTEVETRLREARRDFDRRINALESRGAGFWGGNEFAMAKARAAESVGAYDAGSPTLAEQRLKEALALLDTVEGKAAEALEAQIAAGERALEAGQEALARQAFEMAERIDPQDVRAAQGMKRVKALGGVLPLLVEGENAEARKDYDAAVRHYTRALEMDSNNTRAREGLARANAALGNDTYAKAVGAGFAALGAGRLEEARASFERARRIRPNGKEVAEGLQRIEAASRERDFASIRQRAAALEAEERWEEALREYEAVLKSDPSLAFAQQGRKRTAARAELARQLQDLIDRPERMAAPAVRAEAIALIERAKQQEPSGPVLRSQIARLEILLPEFDKPVRLALISDNATQVAIQRVGSFGTFSRREIELKPGKYTVIGTRAGYRDVRRDITVAPGQEVQTISVACVEPI